MALRTLDPDIVRKLIDGVEDVITPAAESEAELYKSARCPRCFQSGYCVKRVDPPKVVMTRSGPELVQSPFVPNKLLTEGYAKCTNCETEFCPRTGIIRHVEPFLTDVQQSDPPQE
jgi:hypothetical protein